MYNFLSPDGDHIGGNFHKFITNSKGIPVASIRNDFLNNGPRLNNSIEVLEDSILLNGRDITELIKQYSNIETIKAAKFPQQEVRQLLFQLGKDTIKKIDKNIIYNIDKELVEWNASKHLYDNIDAFKAARAQQDIIDMKNAINEILETGQCTNPDFSYNPYNLYQ